MTFFLFSLKIGKVGFDISCKLMRVNCLLDLHEMSKPNFRQKKKCRLLNILHRIVSVKTDSVLISYQITMSTWQLLPWLKRHIYCCMINSMGIILKIVMFSMLWTDLADNKFMFMPELMIFL